METFVIAEIIIFISVENTYRKEYVQYVLSTNQRLL